MEIYPRGSSDSKNEYEVEEYYLRRTLEGNPQPF